MGEMAEYMLNGDDCQSCGEYLGDGDGFPRSCSSCEPRDQKLKPTGPFFSVKHKGSLAGLNQFLVGVHYAYEDLGADKKSNPMFRLYYDKYPEKDHVFGVEKRGIVVVMDRGLVPLVQKAIEHHRKGS